MRCGDDRPEAEGGAAEPDNDNLLLVFLHNFLMFFMLMTDAVFAFLAPSSDVTESKEKRLDGVFEGGRSSCRSGWSNAITPRDAFRTGGRRLIEFLFGSDGR